MLRSQPDSRNKNLFELMASTLSVASGPSISQLTLPLCTHDQGSNLELLVHLSNAGSLHLNTKKAPAIIRLATVGMVTPSPLLIELQHQSLKWSGSPLQSLLSQNSQCVNSKENKWGRHSTTIRAFGMPARTYEHAMHTHSRLTFSRLPMAFTFALSSLLFCF